MPVSNFYNADYLPRSGLIVTKDGKQKGSIVSYVAAHDVVSQYYDASENNSTPDKYDTWYKKEYDGLYRAFIYAGHKERDDWQRALQAKLCAIQRRNFVQEVLHTNPDRKIIDEHRIAINPKNEKTQLSALQALNVLLEDQDRNSRAEMNEVAVEDVSLKDISAIFFSREVTASTSEYVENFEQLIDYFIKNPDSGPDILLRHTIKEVFEQCKYLAEFKVENGVDSPHTVIFYQPNAPKEYRFLHIPPTQKNIELLNKMFDEIKRIDEQDILRDTYEEVMAQLQHTDIRSLLSPCDYTDSNTIPNPGNAPQTKQSICCPRKNCSIM